MNYPFRDLHKGGFRPSTREPCNVHNVEQRLTEVNRILSRSEDYTTPEQQENAVNDIIELIAPNEFGAGLVAMNADGLVTNDAFRRLVMERYTRRNTPSGGKYMKNKRKRTNKKKHRKTKRKKTMKKKHRKSKMK